jgi:hypothetical protein
MIECGLISFRLWSRNVGVMKYTLFYNLTELEQIEGKSHEIHGGSSESKRDIDHIHVLKHLLQWWDGHAVQAAGNPWQRFNTQRIRAGGGLKMIEEEANYGELYQFDIPSLHMTPERSSQPQARWFPTPCLQINKLTSQAVIVSISTL